MKKVAILLVLYNDSNHLPRLIKSIDGQSYKEFEVYAIETSKSGTSSKALKELYPRANILSYQGNLGFAAGNNFLAKIAIEDGVDFLFVLNTDMELSNNSLEVFASYFKNVENLGVIGATLLIGSENKIQLFGVKANCKTQKKEHLYANCNIDTANLPEELIVQYVNGGSTFLSREVYTEVGLFNEDFFMYNDEMDFAYRCEKKGYITMVTSKTHIRHHHNWDNTKKSGNYLMSYYRARNRVLYFVENSLLMAGLIDLLKETIRWPFMLISSIRKQGILFFYFHLLGIVHGVFGVKGMTKIDFSKYDEN